VTKKETLFHGRRIPLSREEARGSGKKGGLTRLLYANCREGGGEVILIFEGRGEQTGQEKEGGGRSSLPLMKKGGGIIIFAVSQE